MRYLLIALLAVTGIGSANAQDPEGFIFEEVIVTAEKRSENLQDTALAISAFTSDTLDQLNITDGEDYEVLVPSLQYQAKPIFVFIRGVGRLSGSLGTDPGVAIYMDGIYSSFVYPINRASSLNTERVEVLRGPQGTLFGRNATGGAISITTRRPTDHFEHHVRIKGGNYNLLNVGASSSGPITDHLRYRVYGYRNTRDGYMENVSGDDLWDDDHWDVGAQIDWDASDRLNLWLRYFTQGRDHRSAWPYGNAGYLITPYLTDVKNTNPLGFNPAYGWDRPNPTVDDPYKVDVDALGYVKTEATHNFTTHISYAFNGFTLKYLGAWHTLESSSGHNDRDFTSNPDSSLIDGGETNFEMQSHELQFISSSGSAFQWVAGLYYYKDKLELPYAIQSLTDTRIGNIVPPFSQDTSNPTPNPDLVYYRQYGELDTTSRAVYADLNYRFSETWKLTLGARYSVDEKKGFESQSAYADALLYGVDYTAMGAGEDCCAWDFTSANNTRTHEGDWSNLSGRIVLDYTPTDNQLIYGSISTGYKSGGFRLGALQDDPSFEPETILSYELGYKATLGGAFLLNGAAYFYTYNDMQVLASFINNQGITLQQVVNANESEIKGLEIEATWLVTDSLRLMANYSLIDGEYTDFCCFIDENSNPGVEQDLSGNTMIQTPRNKVWFNANYTWFTASAGDFSVSGSYSWVDERQYSIYNTDETLADPYYRVDAVATWYSPSDKIRVIAAGKNLTGEQTWTHLSIADSYGSVYGVPNPPRTYTLELQYDF